MSNSNAIGLFDSGIGGLTVIEEVRRVLPRENLVYLGDTARFPYGDKSPEEIRRFAKENAHFLQSKQIKLLAVACYTASSLSHNLLQSILPIPVISMANAGIEELAASTRTQSVAILGTTRTIASGILQQKLLALNPRLQIKAIACPLFAPFVEEGLHDHPTLQQIAEHYLKPLQGTSVDSVLLACTHYQLLTNVIRDILPDNVQLICPANACAQMIQQTLKDQHLLSSQTHSGHLQMYVSGDISSFRRVAQHFLTIPIKKIELAQNENL